MVNSAITYTSSMYDQPPKSPLSGGLHQASIRGTIGERLHIYIVHHNLYRTYAVERSKPCSSAVHRRSTQFPTPDKSGNYKRLMNQATTIEGPSRVRREQRSLLPTEVRNSYFIRFTLHFPTVRMITPFADPDSSRMPINRH